MSTPVPLPALGESVTEGTISRWLKRVGDQVEVDEPLVEVSTDKVDTEIPSPVAGVVLEILVEEDGVAAVGAVLATIGDPSEAGGDGSAPQPEPSAEAAPAQPAASQEQTARDDAAGLPEPEQRAVAAQPAPQQTSSPEASGQMQSPQQPSQEQPRPQPDAGPAPESPSAPAGQESAPSQESAPPAAQGGTEVVLPQLGESVTEGTISRWLKQVGDTVEADEPLVEVSTDKVDTEIPSPTSGVVLEIRVQEDAVAAVGSVLAVIGSPSAAPAAPAPEAAAPQAPAPQAPAPQAPAPEADVPAPAAPSTEAEEPAPAAPSTQVEEPAQNQAASQTQPVTTTPAAPTSPAAPAPAAPAPAAPARAAAAPSPASGASAASPAPAPARRAAVEAPDSGYVTPLVRKMAEASGVDLAAVTGSGVGGRIRKQDVLAAAEAKKAAEEAARKAAEEAERRAAEEAARAAAAPEPAAAPAPPAAAPAAASAAPAADGSKRGTTEKMTRIRATIARRMVESLQVSAQLTATVEVDLTGISRLRAKEKDSFRAREGVGLSYLPFIAKAAVEALKQFPKVNATIDTEAGTITYADAEHLGVAVDTEKGLMVPVIKDAGDLSVTGLAKKIGDLASRSRANKVTPDELSGGTFTITNYGSAGTLFDTPIINQPQVAILGTGALVKRPMVVKDPNLGEIIAVRDMMYLSMSYDHRLVDGADAARFLSFMKARLEEGDFDL